MPQEVWDKVKNHPCYSEEAHHHYARMHVAVAPACNIQCNYCNRKYDCSNESRPGVVSQKLTPEQAVKKVVAVASEIPQMTVLGVAGPGDALANPAKTFDTFRMLQEQAPDIKLCISTNGLALPDQVDEICKYNVDHVTITINMVDPAVGAKIYPWIFWNHKRVTGIEAATILHERQMLGLEMLTARGVLTKINSVLIPGINDEHLIEVNREVKKRGAFLHNIMPLISEAEHGTVFGLTGQRGPTASELKAVQDACMGGANLMRHCRQCRADAVGLLGEDRSEEFTLDKLEQMEVVYDWASARLIRTMWRSSARPSMMPSRKRSPRPAPSRCRKTSRFWWPWPPRAAAGSTSISAMSPSSRSSRCLPPKPCSSAIAGLTSTAKAVRVTTRSCHRWCAPSTTAMRCWWPRLAPAPRTT
jgi:nitrogen fixation protein NifB